ncbi:MAG: CUB domain-containing protein [Mangrovibacterium sp.]
MLKITHLANKRGGGFDLDARLSQEFDELYLSYNFRFSENFNSTAGGKLPGLGGAPLVTANTYPEPHIGFLCKSMFKQAGSLITYHYDRTTGKCPWASSTYKYNPIYFNNGNWYNITRRVVMNTFTNGIANADGIHEVWVDGRMIFQENNLKLMVIESDTMKIDDINIAHFYGGASDDYKTLYECYGYLDNVKVYMPENDPITGHQLHSPDEILQTPDEITDRDVVYDQLISAPGTLENTEYGNTYGGCVDETYLVDAGENKTVVFNLNSYSINDPGDFLFFYDGNRTDSKLIKTVHGTSTGTNLQIKSSGRYLFVRFSTDRSEGGTGWTGNVTFQ